MSAIVELNISDEVYKGLKEVASKDGITIGDVCNTAVDYYILTCNREKKPSSEGSIKESAKKHPRLYALAHKDTLAEKRKAKSVRDGNVIKVG